MQQAPLLVVPFCQFSLSFSFVPQETQRFWFPDTAQVASWHRLWSELQRYLIVFEPPAFVLD